MTPEEGWRPSRIASAHDGLAAGAVFLALLVAWALALGRVLPWGRATIPVDVSLH
jgi:hypothetical protein